MYLLELEFDDDERRLEARAAHRERLHGLLAEGRLVIAGPWCDDSGAALLFDTDLETINRILADDPYYSTPGVRIKALKEWTPIVIRDGVLRRTT